MQQVGRDGILWQDFTFIDPVNKMEPKHMYCERTEDQPVVCGGIYKPGV